MRHSSTCIISHSPNRLVRAVMHHAYPVVGAKVRTIAKNLVKSIVRRNVRKAVALAQIHAIVVTCFVPADAPDQPKKIV